MLTLLWFYLRSSVYIHNRETVKNLELMKILIKFLAEIAFVKTRQ